MSVTMGRFFLIQSVSATLSRSWSENLIPNLGGKVRLAIVETTGSKVEGVRQSVAGGLELSRLRECPIAASRWRIAMGKAKACGNMRRDSQSDTYGSASIQMPGLSAANGGDPGLFSEDFQEQLSAAS